MSAVTNSLAQQCAVLEVIAGQMDRLNRVLMMLHAHVLPLLDLCRYAAMASNAFDGLADTSRALPDFGKRVHQAAPDFCELADYGGGAIVAGTLWVAMDLLRQYADAPELGALRDLDVAHACNLPTSASTQGGPA